MMASVGVGGGVEQASGCRCIDFSGQDVLSLNELIASDESTGHEQSRLVFDLAGVAVDQVRYYPRNQSQLERIDSCLQDTGLGVEADDDDVLPAVAAHQFGAL